jgi:hypothetical protein
MPSGSFIIGDSTAFTYSVSSGGAGTWIRCSTSSSVASQTGLAVNDSNFPIDPSSNLRWVKLHTMSITKASGTAGFNVFTGTTANTTSSGGVLPVLSERSYYQATTGLTYGAIFTSSGSLSLFRTNFSGGTVSTNVSSTTLSGNLRASFTYHTLPYAPQSFSASVSGQTINLSWSAPADNGGTAVQRYRIEVSVNNGPAQLVTDSATGTSLSYSGDVGSTYVFKVAAITTMVQNLRIAESVPNATGPFTTSNTVSITATTGTVPNVIGQTENSAINSISNAGFFASRGGDITSGATSENNGTVASQSPSGGTTAPLNSSVTYNLYSFTPPTTTTVPNVVGQTESNARNAITNATLVPSVTYTSTGATLENNGTVASQNPTGGTTVNLNSTVSIVVYQFTLNLGKRMTGSSTSTPITIARRYNGTGWVNITTVRRFDGTNWVNLSN